MGRMKTNELLTARLALLPLGMLVVGTEVMAQAARTVHDVAERELGRLMGEPDCCCGDDEAGHREGPVAAEGGSGGGR